MDGGSIKPALPREGILVQTGFGPEAAGFSGDAGEVLTMTPTEERAPVDRTAATGSVGLVLVVAVALVAIAVLLLFIGREWAEPYILAMLSLFAVVGVFALFAQAAGVLEFAGRKGKNDLTQALADGAGEGIALVDWSGRVLYANRAYLNLTDAEGADDVRPVERLFTNDPGVADAIYRLAQAAREGNALSEEIRIAGGAGSRWLRVRVRPLGKQGRQARIAAWGVSDITRERERQENTFLELQHAIDFLDHAPAGFFSLDPQGRVLYINATLAGWLNYDLAEFVPQRLTFAELVQGPGAELLQHISPAPGEVKTEIFDLDLKRKNGQGMPVRLYHRVAYAVDGTAGASRTLVLNRARGDVPDALRAAEVRFARFFNHTPVAIAMIDRKGRIGQSNPSFARLFGPAAAGEGGETRAIVSVVAERDREKLESFAREAMVGAAVNASVEVALSGAPGRFARFYVTPVEGEEDGEAAIVHAIETTDQRALEAQFSQAQKMQAVGQLAGGVAHDFNNVLTAIIGYSDLLLANHRPTDPSFQDLMQIKQNANRAASMVRQLLAFSRQQTLRPQVLALGDVLSDLSIGLLKRIIGETVELELKHGRDLWPVKADLNQFEQVIVNLAVNARDAMPDGGKLSIRTRNVSKEEAKKFGYVGFGPSDHVLIEVQDSGVGIPPDVLGKIFEPFFTTKELGKGTGLGLSTVYGIVKQSNGYIHAASEPGRGTTFQVFLPRHMVSVEDKPARPAEPEAAATDLTGHGTVLLVEDEEAVRAFAARALSSRGFTVLQAGSGVEALEMIERHAGKIDLVVSDVVMPEMDGPTLLRELRKQHADLAVIFVSGYAEEAFRKNLSAGEKFTFLPKPFTLKQLVAAVKETIQS
jgi:two-component system, cell cycle sensor histidine kinase and response regulator CckA